MLGLYIYPPPKGTEYTAADLEQPDKVIELFGYCGILEGLITKEGWDFLIQLYGYEKLFEMDKAGMWFDAETGVAGVGRLLVRKEVGQGTGICGALPPV